MKNPSTAILCVMLAVCILVCTGCGLTSAEKALVGEYQLIPGNTQNSLSPEDFSDESTNLTIVLNKDKSGTMHGKAITWSAVDDHRVWIIEEDGRILFDYGDDHLWTTVLIDGQRWHIEYSK